MPTRFYTRTFLPSRPRTDSPWYRDRVDRPGTMLIRVDDIHWTPLFDGEGRQMTDGEGRPRRQARAVFATSLCSGEKLLMRLSTDREEELDGTLKSPGSRGKSIAELLERSRRTPGEIAHLPEERRPVWRCDRSRPVRDGRGGCCVLSRGGGETPEEHLPQLRCAWITSCDPWVNRFGEEVNPVDHMEAARFSTVNVSLSANRDGSPSYFTLYADAVREAARAGEESFSRACWQAAGTVTTVWREERARSPQARFGTLSATTWHPEESFRFPVEDAWQSGFLSLMDFLSDRRFESLPGAQGDSPPPAARPDCLLRFLDGRDEICGMIRVRAWDFLTLPEWARRNGLEGGQSYWESPEGRARYLCNEAAGAAGQGLLRERGAVQVDVLPGRCYSPAYDLIQPEARRCNPGAGYAQVRSMLWLGLSQTRCLGTGPRQNIGCGQFFLQRTHQDQISALFSLRDGSSCRNAALLLPGSARLRPSEAYGEELEAERHRLTHLSECFAGPGERREAARSPHAEREPHPDWRADARSQPDFLPPSSSRDFQTGPSEAAGWTERSPEAFGESGPRPF